MLNTIDYSFIGKYPISQLSIELNDLKKMYKVVEKALKSQGEDPRD